MRASSPPSIARTKSSAWATRSASQSWSSVASGSAYRRLLATVPLKRKGFCGTRPMRDQTSVQGGLPDVAADQKAPPVTS
jgi:hypothetical protein